MSREQSNKELTCGRFVIERQETRETVRTNREKFTTYRDLISREHNQRPRQRLRKNIREIVLYLFLLCIHLLAETLMNSFMLAKDCVFNLFTCFVRAFV